MGTDTIAPRAPLSLQILTGISRLMPPVRGTGRIALSCLLPLYRRSGCSLLHIWPGIDMMVDPHDCLGGLLAFVPSRYDRWERQALARILRPGDVFVDVGSNIGAYALWAARCVGPSGRVLAIEADERNHRLLAENVRLNGFEEFVTPVCRAISDRNEELHLYRSITGNCGGNNLCGRGEPGPTVKCIPLDQILSTVADRPIRMIKFDIEGFELRVLRRYFDVTPRSRLPEYLLVEIDGGPAGAVEKQELRRMILGQGYVAVREEENSLFRRL